MSLKLYYDLLSQPSRALYIFFKTCNIPFEKKPVSIKDMEHVSPEYQKIHPFNKVPAIEHNGSKIIESVAILRYICREYKVPDHWYPSESKRQVKVDEYLEWQHLNIRLHGSLYFRMKVLVPLFTGKPVAPEKLIKFKKTMIEALDLLENVWLKDSHYLVGSEISVADILGACEVEQVRMAGYNPRDGRPRLAAWMGRVAGKTNPYYEEAHVILNKIAKKAEEKAEILSSL